MNLPIRVSGIVGQDVERYRRCRARLPELAAGLSVEDLAGQSMPDASPGKWHLAHTSWFFEVMILARRAEYTAVDDRLQVLFNSYYETLGHRLERSERGLMTRPSLDDVMAYRREIDRLYGKSQAKGHTVVPLAMVRSGNRIKVEIALVQGKKQHDKRQAIREREMDREVAEAMSRANKGR